MKKHREPTPGELLLGQVVEECLEEDLSFVPPEREIARTHRFSEAFEQAMEKLFGEMASQEEQRIKRHFSVKYGQLAACVLLFVLCGGIFAALVRQSMKSASELSGSAETTEEILEDTAAAAEVTEEEAEAPAEAASGALEDSTGGTAEEFGGDRTAQKPEEEKASGASVEDQDSNMESLYAERTKQYCGGQVERASRQEVPETLDYVTTLVNCPVQDEENPTLYLTIGNVGEELLKYNGDFVLEVWLEDGWYVVPSARSEPMVWKELEPGMAVDVELDLTKWAIDYGAERYRLITHVNEEFISAEFTFSERFREKMEEKQ